MLRERQRTGEESVREETVFLTWGQEVRTAEGSWWWWGGGWCADVPGQAESIMGWIPSHQVGAL